MESQFYQINILKLLLRWKLHLAVIVIVAALLGAIFSGPVFITPKFKSYAVVYPSNIAPYSDESETEQMLQIMHSKDIRDSVIKRFDLAKHYGIDSTYKYFYSTMLYEYSQNVKIGQTPYEGVNIEVMDKDPQIAAEMVNSIIEFYNEKVRRLHEGKFGEVAAMYDRALKKKMNYIDSLESRFIEISTEYGLLDYTSQSREIARGYLKTIDGSGAGNINTKEVNRLKENIEKMGGEFIILQNLLVQEAARLADLRRDAERAYMDYDRQFTYTNIITKPYASDRKAYPIRWLIVVISALAAFFVAFIVILILENYKGLSATPAAKSIKEQG
jgi:capsular polysaccharide biosynthesis protein